jgi:phenylacetate-CoA ligase
MSLPEFLTRHLFYPLWLLREGQYGILSRIKRIRATSRLSSEQLRDRQLKLLRDTLVHAYRFCPWYKRTFQDCSFDPTKITNVEQMRVLPILTKDVVNRNREDLVSEEHRRQDDLYESKTGGSSGIPMTFYRDKECLLYRRALDHFLDSLIGFEIGQQQALLWGNPSDVPLVPTSKSRLLDRLVWRRFSYLPVALDKSELLHFVAQLKGVHPRMLKAYPSLLYFLCRFLENEDLGPLEVPIVVPTAEQLFDFQRDLAERALHCEVYEKYGAREIGTVAVECGRHSGLHLITESVLIEIEPLPGFEEQGVGRMIITDLRNRAMPLIRYDIGDLATVDHTPCACGLQFPRLRNIQGRTTDILHRKDGTPIAGLEFTDPITYSGIANQVQLVQSSPGELEVRVVNLSKVSEVKLDYIRKKLLAMLGEGGLIRFQDVDRIERDKSGKFRYVMKSS